MERSAARAGVYAAIGACGGFAFGLAGCFAVALLFIMLGCPEPRGQVCQDAADLAASIARVWYLFAVPIGTVAGIIAYRVAKTGSLSSRRKIADSLIARVLVYAAGTVVVSLSLLIAGMVGTITSYRGGLKCPVESAYACSEAGMGEIMLGILIVAIALAVAISSVVIVYRFTRSNVEQ